MHLFCLIGRHRPLPLSISRNRLGKYAALCERCSVPLERGGDDRWRAVGPLI